MWGSDVNMCVKRISIYLKFIASIHKLLNERSMEGIRIIHNTKWSEVSKHMGQVQDNPSIMCMGRSEYSVALNTIERAIVHHVWGNQGKLEAINGICHMRRNDIVATKHVIGASNPRGGCNMRKHRNQVVQTSGAKMQHTRGNHGNHVMCASSRHRQCTWHIASTKQSKVKVSS